MTDRTVYRKKERVQPPEIPAPEMTPLQKIVAAQTEAITVAGEPKADDEWNHESDDDQQSTNTGSIVSIERFGETKIRQTMNLRLQAKGKFVKEPLKHTLDTEDDQDDEDERYSIVQSLRSRVTSTYEFSLPDDTIASDEHVEDLLNQAIMDDALVQHQQSDRKRPKKLLLGIIIKIFFA